MAWKSDSPYYPDSAPVHKKPEPTKPKQAALPFCTQCGRQQNLDFAFCPGCGNPKADPLKRDPKKICDCGTAFGRKDRYCQCCGKARPTT